MAAQAENQRFQLVAAKRQQLLVLIVMELELEPKHFLIQKVPPPQQESLLPNNPPQKQRHD
jgi:hypothetical protein